MRKYFVSYLCDGSTLGCREIVADRKICDFNAIKTIVNHIESLGYKNVTILNWREFESDEAEEKGNPFNVGDKFRPYGAGINADFVYMGKHIFVVDNIDRDFVDTKIGRRFHYKQCELVKGDE
jgi:hypothetical protein